jgi:peptidoglycan/LPS O-acetylase OafA/YrhL
MSPSSPFSPGKTERLIVLDGLRGVAAFAVILDHVPSQTLVALLPGRYLAVDFFLVLSGVVLARAYGPMLEKPGMAGAFIKARLIRLYPFYFLGLMAGLSVASFLTFLEWGSYGFTHIAVSLAFGLLFLPDLTTIHSDENLLFPLNPPAWTLFMEFLANILYAISIRFLRPYALILLLCVLGIATTIGLLSSEDVGPGWKWNHFDTGLTRILFTFLMGVCIQRVLHLARACTVPAWAAFGLLILILAFPATDALRRPYDALTAIALMPALVFVSAYAQVSGNLARLCAWLGAVSYGVYVLHLPIYLGLNTLITGLDIQISGTAKVVLVALISAGSAHLLSAFVEKPVRAYLSDRFVPKTSAGTETQ